MTISKFEYPRLGRSEIFNILAEAQIAAVSEHDLLRPNCEFISDLYTRILICLGFINEEDNEQVEFSALEQLENPDLHVDSVRIMTLYVKIKEAVSSLNCPKRFTLKDLLKPDSERTEFFISALLNFFLYKSSKMELLSPIINELTLLEEQRKEWGDKISELNAELEKINEAREKELPFIHEEEAKVKELHQTIASLNNQQAALRVSIRKLKEKTGEMDEKISNAEFALVQSVQENANLHSRIVQSPEKLQKALEEKKLALENAKNAERLELQSFQEKTATAEVYTKVHKKMTKHFSRMQSIQEQVNASKSVDKEFKALKSKLSDDGVIEKSLEAKLLERQGKVETLEELKRQSEKERDAKCDEAAIELNQVKLDVQSRRQELEARQKNVEAVVGEVDAITARTASLKESDEAKKQVLLSKCEAIVKQFREYTKSLETEGLVF